MNNILIAPFTKLFEVINSAIISIGIHTPGVAYFFDIFIFTAILKFAILPLTITQTRSMVKSGELQPKLKELQEKYKSDPKMLQQKQMELYKEMGVNPLAGCLPILIQFPIFMAMYYVIYHFQGFHNVPYPGFDTGFNHVAFLWVRDLGGKDKTFILPVLSGVTSFLSMLMVAPKGKTNDPTVKSQKQMNVFFAIFSVYLGISFKAALVIYWIVGNLIQMLQQYFIIGRIRKKEEAKLVK